MELTTYSRNRIKDTADFWNVADDHYEPIYSYLVHGFSPGSFFSGLLANDFRGAIQHSHPCNTVQSMKNLVEWVHDRFPTESFGSYTQVGYWCDLSDQARRAILEADSQLIYTEQEEIMLTLRAPSVPNRR